MYLSPKEEEFFFFSSRTQQGKFNPLQLAMTDIQGEKKGKCWK